MKHGLAVLEICLGEKINGLKNIEIKKLLEEAIVTRKWIAENVVKSREKDFTNPFRKMSYLNEAEMESVLGKLDENVFIKEHKIEMKRFQMRVKKILMVI